ncbi:MAG: hypothetical protein R3A79_01735 [Nannocystaceae bacterium]
MAPRLRQLLFGLVVAALWLVVAAPALAAPTAKYGVVTVDLRPEGGEVPTHLCVVSEVASPRARTRLSDLLVAGDGEVREDGRIWPVQGAAWGAEGIPPSRSCGAECAPQVLLPTRFHRASELHAACTADSLISEDAALHEPRLLVMMLEHLEGSPPAIESVALAGGVVTIGVEADLRRIVVTARSLGGHYEPQRRSVRAEGGGDAKLVVLPLAPRCQWAEFVIPSGRLRERDRQRLGVRVLDDAVDVDTCVGTLAGDGHLRILVPRVEPGRQAGIAVAVAADGGRDAGHFGGRWEGPWPPPIQTLKAHQIAFVWRPPECVYSETSCPRAELEAGITCTATRAGDACHYLCPEEVDAGDPVVLAPPLTVRFEKEDPRQRWTDILSRVGQTLGSYVTGDTVYVHADIRGWEKDVPGARIRHLEILGADGSARRFPLAGVERVQIPLPGPTCEPLRAKAIGDRFYDEELAPIRGGEVILDAPERRARIMTFNLLLAQGGSLALLPSAPPEIDDPSYFVVLGQLAARFRPRRPKLARLSGELRLGGTIGQWGFYSTDSIGDDPRRTDKTPIWVRFLFEPAIVVDIVHPVSMSAGLGIGGSWPLRSEDVPDVGRFSPILAPSLDARFAVRRWLSLVLQARMVFGERTLATLEAEGDPMMAQRAALQTYSLAGLYGLLVSF